MTGWKSFILICLNTLALCSFLLLLFAWFGGSFWLAELAISFAPQQLLLALIIATLNLLAWKAKESKTKFFSLNSLLAILTSLTVLILGSLTVFGFSGQPPIVQTVSYTEAPSLRVAVFNKLFHNKNFDEITQAVRELQPDVIGFAEIYPDSPLVEKLKQDYPYAATWPYSNRLEEGTFGVGDLAIFSKTPLSRIELVEIEGSPLMKAETVIHSEVYQIILVHPSAPYTPELWKARDEQLPKIAEYTQKVKADYVDFQVLMGDFNTTPWSPAYKDLEQGLEGLYNVAEGRGLQLTWDASKFKGFSPEMNSILFQAHIDHIFVTDNLSVQKYQVAGSYGSDHNLIWADLQEVDNS